MKKFADTLSAKKRRMTYILNVLSSEYPEAKIQLDFNNPFELLVATILSAQCTDARVNIVTKDLFKKYKIPKDYLLADREVLERDIFSTGFYKAKAKNIQNAARKVIDDFAGEVPGTMKELLSLPGVGRKTANVILGHIFDVPGIVVDTHVIRISNRLGFVETKNPEKIEFALMDIAPKKKWVIMTHYFILHGRKICSSRKPKCEDCLIEKYCPKIL